MNAKTIEPTTKLYSGTGFSALTIAELPAGSEVETLSIKKQERKKWVSVKLIDGRIGFLSGETKVLASGRASQLEDAYAKSAPWKATEREHATEAMVVGGLWFFGGVLAIAIDVYIVHVAISSGSTEIAFPVKPVLLMGLIAAIYGGFRLLMGVLAYLRSFSD